MKWTDQQKEVIDSRGVDILVSAAAGSGKTAVLTARILKLLEEGYSLDEFLVITFTRAGAKDMKEKIRRQMVEKSKGPRGAFFAQELKKLPRAQISTIHSFCSSILKENFHILDIDPNYRVAGEGELRIMEEESLDEVMELYYKKGEALFYDLLEIFTNQRSDLGLRSVIMETENFLSQKPRRQAYLEGMKKNYQNKDFWWNLLFGKRKEELEEKREEFKSIYQEILPLVMTKELLGFLEEEKTMLLSSDYSQISYERFPSKKFMEEELYKEEIKSARNKWKELFEVEVFEKDFEELYEKLKASYVYLEKLIEITDHFSEVFYKRRLLENKLSFSDLEKLALEAMEKEEVAKFYKKKFSFVFIDEYQDTNELQEYLVSLFVREGGLFMVGDIKQSIYAFREAKPELFIEKFHSYAQLENKQRIDLTKNFRSAQPILAACNHVFEKLMRKEFGGIDYDDAARLVFGNEELRDIEEDVEFLVTQSPGDAHEEEIRSIIARIQELIKAGASYKDIVILYRSPKSFIEAAITLFREAGLPLFSDQGESYLESLEVQILLNYLELINNSFLDLPLLSLLRLPRYGFSDQELYSLRSKKQFFHQGFYDYNEEGELLDKKNFFLEEIRSLRWKSRQMGVAELLHFLYQEVEFEEFALLMSGGEQRLMNIRYLFERAKEFEESTMVGLPAFLNYIDKLREQKQDYESAKLLGEEADVIRLMSIHKSKGLQFPIVFVAGLWKRYNESNYRGPIFFGEDVFVMDFFDLENRIKEKSIFKRVLIEKDKIKARQEEVRLLYVAMTRAQHKLILSTYLKEELSPGHLLSNSELQVQRSFHDLLVKSLPCFVPPAPKYVMIEAISYDKKQGLGPRGQALDFFLPPPPRKEAYKASISSLSREKSAPSFHFSSQEGGIRRGTLFHRAMEIMDLDLARQDLEAELKRLQGLGPLKDFADGHLVEVFLHSSLGKRMLQSPKILREQPFILKKDQRLLQGVVDLAFWEEGWVLVDYKTDRSFDYLESYKTQLGFYKEAFEKITGEEVKDALLYFLRLNKTITIKENIDES